MVGFGPGFWRQAIAAAAEAQTGPGPYGELGDPDANGLRLPAGFTSRLIARADQRIGETSYALPWYPDGAATYETSDGGWILTVNSEIPLALGGVSAIRFGPDAEIVDAYRILGGTSTNCSGGRTPWGTWLSCEEMDSGWVYECDPTGATRAEKRSALGQFKHEAACVDTVEQRIYMTEDLSDGGLYRFTPTQYPSLESGILEIASVADDGHVSWTEVPDPAPGAGTPTREQVSGSTQFARGEGIWYDAGHVYVATTSDETIHDYEVASSTISTLYRQADTVDSPLQGVDAITVSQSGDLYVCEDSYDDDPDAMDVCLISREGTVSRFVKLTGDEHFGAVSSEVTGVTFDPSGTRMYFGSQRAWGFGAIYEVTGPFRLDRPGGGDDDQAGLDGALGLDFPRRLRIRRLLRRGLTIRLTLDAPGELSARLTAKLPDGQHTKRRKTIAKKDVKLGRGSAEVVLRARDEKMRSTLRSREHSLSATLELRLKTDDGSDRLRRRVRLLAD